MFELLYYFLNKKRMEDLMLPKVMDPETGEFMDIRNIKDIELDKCIASLPNQLLSQFLSQANFVRRVAEKLEGRAKEIIKMKVLYFNAEGKAEFEQWRISKVKTTRFDEKKLMEEGSEIEKTFYKSIKEKYSVETEYIKF